MIYTNALSSTGSTTAEDVGLGNVDDTSDASKPVSTAQQAALNAKVAIADIANSLSVDIANVPLSAKMGKVLKGHIDTINALLQSDADSLDTLQEVVDYVKLNRSDLENLSVSGIVGLQTALNAKVDTSDGRLSDSREWSGDTVSQAEAEAGTSTARRAWTALRIKQAIVSAVSSIQAKLNGIEPGATQNATDSALRARGSHTGTQSASTITGLSDSATTSVSSIQQGTTKGNVGLSLVPNVDSTDASTLNKGTVPEARLPASAFVDTTYSAGSGLTFNGTVINVDNPFNPFGSYASLRAGGTTKGDVGLSVVDNTSDTDKPVSTPHQTALDAKINSSDKGSVNGVATLDGNTKIPLSQINDAVLGQVSYNGTWNALTNTPTLSTTPNQKGDYYVVSTAGTFASINFVTGDWIISNGSIWEKVDNTDSVSSVSGRTGNVVVTKADVGLSNVRNVDAYSKTESNANYATDSQGTLADNAQPKESGKGLSSNDYTTTEKSRLTDIESFATNNDTNAQLRARSSHTGTQPVSTIAGLSDAATTNVATIQAGTTKANVGLSDVDNTSDMDKPVSNAQSAAISDSAAAGGAEVSIAYLLAFAGG